MDNITITTKGVMFLERYGQAVKLPRKTILGAYAALAIIVPVIIPLPLVAVLNKYLPTHWRYNTDI